MVYHICGGKMEENMTTYTAPTKTEFEISTLTEVHAHKCTKCGEILYNKEDVERFNEQIESLEKVAKIILGRLREEAKING